jgi:hypothetical protein
MKEGGQIIEYLFEQTNPKSGAWRRELPNMVFTKQSQIPLFSIESLSLRRQGSNIVNRKCTKQTQIRPKEPAGKSS